MEIAALRTFLALAVLVMGLMLAFGGEASAHVQDGHAGHAKAQAASHSTHADAAYDRQDRDCPSHQGKGRHCVFATSCCVATVPSGLPVPVVQPVTVGHGLPGQDRNRSLASVGLPAKPPRL